MMFILTIIKLIGTHLDIKKKVIKILNTGNNILANIIGGGGSNILHPGSSINLNEATAVASDILSGKTAFTKDGLTLGNLIKGRNFASGAINAGIPYDGNSKVNIDRSTRISLNLSFNPSYIFANIYSTGVYSSASSSAIGGYGSDFYISNLTETSIDRILSSSYHKMYLKIIDVSSSGFTIFMRPDTAAYYYVDLNNLYWYAIG